ncbi:MAG: DUF4421 domain-containing protein [Bacteroidales bacterium]|nr:DUF4421 domain-containing protein [Bacteroidales bacterium]
MKFRILCLLISLFALRLAADTPVGAEVCPEPVDPPVAIDLPDSLILGEWMLTEVEMTDTMQLLPRKQNPNWWLNRIKNHTYDIKDTTVIYPRFAGFCVKAYNWADRVFNTYNHDYVMPTGKKWKLLWKSALWTDSYALDMPSNVHMRMLSRPYMSSGPYLSFMAVTVGYGANLNRLLFNSEPRQKRYDFSFSTSLFEIDLYYTSNKGGTRLRRFEPFDQGRYIDVEFPSLRLENYGLAGFYFFNHGRYYQGAAYNYSKIQMRNQGSWILGFAVSHQDISFDLCTLSDDMKIYLPPSEKRVFKFIYNDYCLIAGYGYNWVFNPHWVFNFTGMPAFGLRHCLEANGDGRKNLPALNLSGRAGLAYNLRNFFVGIFGSVQANWYINQDYSFINGILSGGVAAGLRF